MRVRDVMVWGFSLVGLGFGSSALGAGALSVLWDNGPVITDPTGGTGSIAGQPISRPQPVPNSSLVSTTPGISATTAFGIRVAEDFTVPAGGWDLDSVKLFAFQSSQTAPTITSARINLWTSAPFDALSPQPIPNPLPQPVLSAAIEVSPTASAFVGFRQLGSSTSGSTRRIFSYDFSLDGLPNGGRLEAGTYWLEWSLAGVVVPNNTSATQVVVPLVTPRENAINLNARQFAPATINGQQVTTWFESREIRWELIGSTQTGFFDQPMALPFALSGTPIPEPATLVALGMLGFLAIKRR